MHSIYAISSIWLCSVLHLANTSPTPIFQSLGHSPYHRRHWSLPTQSLSHLNGNNKNILGNVGTPGMHHIRYPVETLNQKIENVPVYDLPISQDLDLPLQEAPTNFQTYNIPTDLTNTQIIDPTIPTYIQTQNLKKPLTAIDSVDSNGRLLGPTRSFYQVPYNNADLSSLTELDSMKGMDTLVPIADTVPSKNLEYVRMNSPQLTQGPVDLYHIPNTNPVSDYGVVKELPINAPDYWNIATYSPIDSIDTHPIHDSWPSPTFTRMYNPNADAPYDLFYTPYGPTPRPVLNHGIINDVPIQSNDYLTSAVGSNMAPLTSDIENTHASDPHQFKLQNKLDNPINLHPAVQYVDQAPRQVPADTIGSAVSMGRADEVDENEETTIGGE